MLNLLWMIPVLPLAGFLLLVLMPHGERRAALIGCGSVGIAFLLAVGIFVQSGGWAPGSMAATQTLWTWFEVEGLRPGIGFYLDGLSLTMTGIITGVGFLIHVYSAYYMHGDAGFARYFAWLNLFVSAMLVLVLADNLVLLYLGWEGVGLCSYLLIGFWYRNPENGYAARKAFVVTRVGDTSMAIGLFLLATHFGTLDIQAVQAAAARDWTGEDRWLATLAALLLLGGAIGKSAQLPLQTWLPDAMAGPTPVSALIHAATMVTAGVYLIARMHGLYLLSPTALTCVAVVGAATLLLAGCTALCQRDIKRILAWSTVSQIGYMFLALGVGAWSAAIFHLMTHAFFKALLFMAAGTVIHSLHEEQDIFNMGGLRRDLPFAYFSFLAGGASLAALPLVTAGFYSKDAILLATWDVPWIGWLLWLVAMAGALITAVYIFRLIFIVFHGEKQKSGHEHAGLEMRIPLAVLGVLALVGGFIRPPLDDVFLVAEAAAHHAWIPVLASLVSILGVGIAWHFFLRHPARALAVADQYAGLGRFWGSGWGFDALYDRLFVNPFVALARASRRDLADRLLWNPVAALSRLSHDLLSRTQNGQMRWYAGGIAVGCVLVVTGSVML